MSADELPGTVVRDQLRNWTPLVRTGIVPATDYAPEAIVYQNSLYSVAVRELPFPLGPPYPTSLIWLCIVSLDGSARHDWREFQYIKNEIVGVEAEGVEVYPAESRLHDSANDFHMWCLPGLQFPFGFKSRHVSGIPASGKPQRAFTDG